MLLMLTERISGDPVCDQSKSNTFQLLIFVELFFIFARPLFVQWWESAGSKTVWSIIAGVCSVLALGGIPRYIFGKKLRAFWSNITFWVLQTLNTSL